MTSRVAKLPYATKKSHCPIYRALCPDVNLEPVVFCVPDGMEHVPGPRGVVGDDPVEGVGDTGVEQAVALTRPSALVFAAEENF